uniref:Uncharacterized protein n=1 Tax=viral metagenome TaxID=1070528 RepID=A0A6C0HD02_9ZZZZ
MEQVKQNYTNLKTYNEQIGPLLDEYKKGYVYYYTNPDNNEYARIFSIASGNITALNKDLFVTTNDIQKNIDDLNVKLATLDTNIKKEKKENDHLVSKLVHIEGKGKGSQVMNSNSKELYKQQYISNWDMVVGILIISGALVTVFRKPNLPAAILPKK